MTISGSPMRFYVRLSTKPGKHMNCTPKSVATNTTSLPLVFWHRYVMRRRRRLRSHQRTLMRSSSVRLILLLQQQLLRLPRLRQLRRHGHQHPGPLMLLQCGGKR